MARTSASRSTAASLSSAASAALPWRTVVWMTASACGTPRSSSIASAKAGGTFGRRPTTPPAFSTTRWTKPSIRANAGLGLAQCLLAVLDHRPVVRGAEVVAQHDRAPALDHLADQHRVAQRLRHLLAAMVTQAVVQPVRRELVAEGLGLGDLVLVVREDQVDPAAVDVEGAAEILVRHGGALQVPAGPAAAPRGLPGRLAGLGRLPHARSPAGRACRSRPSPDGWRRSSRSWLDSCSTRERAHVEVDVAAGLVRVAALDEAAHHLDHLGDVAGGARFVAWAGGSRARRSRR